MAPTAPFDRARRAVASSVRTSLGAAGSDLDEYRIGPGDPGLFGVGSPVWTVHGDLPSMLIGGMSALMAQTLHPLAMAGVAAHSGYRDDRFGRLRRTARFIAGTTFGSTVLAESLVEEVRAVHAKVRGTAPDGRSYSADDPALLTYVHVSEVGSFLQAYQRYGPRPLLRVEKDRYLDEVAVIAQMLGAPDVPKSVVALRAYRRRIAPELSFGDQAKEALAFLRQPASDLLGERVAHHIVIAAAEDLLPSDARRIVRSGVILPRNAVLVRAAATSVAAALRWAIGPSIVREIARERIAEGVDPRNRRPLVSAR